MTPRALALLLMVAITMSSLYSAAGAQGTPEAGTADGICAVALATPEANESPEPANLDQTALDFDLIFLEAMIPHHQSAIDMAIVVNERTERQELRDFTQQLIELRTVELAMMGGWRTDWYADTPALTELQLVDAMNVKLAESPGVGGVAGLEEMGAEHASEHLADLCAAGDDLDRAYIDTMLATNSAAIILAREAINRAEHREIKNLGDSIAVQQQTEIDQLLTWREIWFQGTPIPDHHDG